MWAMKQPQFDPCEQRIFVATRKIGFALLIAGSAGVVGMALWASQTAKPLQLGGVALLVGCAAAALGSVLGFLFDVQRNVEAVHRLIFGGPQGLGDGYHEDAYVVKHATIFLSLLLPTLTFIAPFAYGQEMSLVREERMANPVDRLLSRPYGAAGYARFRQPSGSSIAAFLIREPGSAIRSLPAKPTIEVRTGLFQRFGVAVIPIMFLIEAKVYETWVNIQAPEHLDVMRDLATQDILVFAFYDTDTQAIREITMNNLLRYRFSKLIASAQAVGSWTDEQFDAAKDELYREYPSPRALWAAIR